MCVHCRSAELSPPLWAQRLLHSLLNTPIAVLFAVDLCYLSRKGVPVTVTSSPRPALMSVACVNRINCGACFLIVLQFLVCSLPQGRNSGFCFRWGPVPTPTPTPNSLTGLYRPLSHVW